MFQRPPASEWTPGFQVRVLQTPSGKLLSRPVVSAFRVGRRRQSWADDVAQIRKRLHHLRAIHPLVFDADDWIVRIGRRLLRSRLLAERSIRNEQSKKQKCGGKLASNHFENPYSY